MGSLLTLSPFSPLRNYLFLPPLVDYELLEGRDNFLLLPLILILIIIEYPLSSWYIKYVQHKFIG